MQHELVRHLFPFSSCMVLCVTGISFPELTWKLRRMGEAMGLWEAVGLFWNCLSDGGQGKGVPDGLANFLTFMRCYFLHCLRNK